MLRVVEALEYLSQWNEAATASKAKTLLHAIQNAEFVVTLHCQVSVFSLILPLSRLLQKKTLDLEKAATLVLDLISVLKTDREHCSEKFSNIFSKASDILSKLGAEMMVPRVTQKRQVHRVSVPSTSAEEYYRRAIYIPLLDSVISNLQARFSSDVLLSFKLTNLLPQIIINLNSDQISSLAESLCNTYGMHLNLQTDLESAVTAELRLWNEKWSRSCATNDEVIISMSVEEALANCDSDIYFTVNSLLKLLLTLPVSVATAERSFSTLRRLKTWLRNHIGEERLSGLALLNIHRETELNAETIIDRFAKSRSRRLQFLL